VSIFRRRRQQQEKRLAAARAEADRSQERLAYVREHVVEPITAAGQRNQFADMLRRSLIEGHSK
jgi:hypothetical protein